MAAALAQVRDLDEEVPRELALDTEAVSPVLRITRSATVTLPGAYRGWSSAPGPTNRRQQLTARNRIGQVRLERQAVVARSRNGRVARISNLIESRS